MRTFRWTSIICTLPTQRPQSKIRSLLFNNYMRKGNSSVYVPLLCQGRTATDIFFRSLASPTSKFLTSKRSTIFKPPQVPSSPPSSKETTMPSPDTSSPTSSRYSASSRSASTHTLQLRGGSLSRALQRFGHMRTRADLGPIPERETCILLCMLKSPYSKLWMNGSTLRMMRASARRRWRIAGWHITVR